MPSAITFTQVDYHNPEHAEALLSALERYAQDPMGGGQGLSDAARANLIPSLAQLPHALSILMQVDGETAGLANCFEGFSTFACRTLLNIHDFVVLPAFRGRGLARHLLVAVESEAQRRGCCKLTLEVLEGNAIARHAYERYGFQPYALDPALGHALFLEKSIPND